jgi:hypothetical protein
MRPYLKNSFTKTGLVEWLKVKALSSSPSTTKKEKKNPIFILVERVHQPYSPS